VVLFYSFVIADQKKKIFVGTTKCRFLQPLADKVKLKLASWKGKSLSMIGRIQLDNTVITEFLAYSFNIYK